ncbi:carboxy-terminal protease [compost metagenome]
MAKSLDYKVMEQDIAELNKSDKEVSVSLNEAKLKQERDSLEAKSLAKVNSLRASRGLAPVKKGDKIKKEESFDFIQDESLRIMADFMQMTDPAAKGLVKNQGAFN